MDIKDILKTVDHTLLAQSAGCEDIRSLCEEGVKYGAASVCIPPSYVKQASDYLRGRLPVCTVIGFPNGYSTTASKCFETRDAVENGADEIDMVINIGWVKDKRWPELLEEIRAVRAECPGRVLKVIIETCLLTEAEKIKMCEIVSQSGADYIKTSTGFAGGGATLEDVALMRKHSAPHVKVKASGGISGPGDGEAFLSLGADRLGTSRVIKAVMAGEAADGSGY